MSYDIYLTDPVTGETLRTREPHYIAGGSFTFGDTTELWLNITWNYAPFYYRVFGDAGIRTIYGMRGKVSLPLFDWAVRSLRENRDPNYWTATEGNARAALLDLAAFAKLEPNGVWRGD